VPGPFLGLYWTSGTDAHLAMNLARCFGICLLAVGTQSLRYVRCCWC